MWRWPRRSVGSSGLAGDPHRQDRGASLHAAALITYVVTDAAGANTAEYIAAAAAGLVIGPCLAFRLGHALAAHHPQRL